MNANELTFGVEFEVLVPAGTISHIGGYHAGAQIAELPQGWNAQRDGSIQSELGFDGVEVVSPILKGPEGVTQLKTACEWFARVGAKVNRSTGFHVHVGFDRRDRASLDRLVNMVANHEKAIYASTGTRSRESSCYCRSIQRNEIFRDHHLEATDRYHVLNLTNITRGSRPTVEFRAFAGTMSLPKVLGHVMMCLGLVEKSIATKKQTQWVAKTPVASSPIVRGGEGTTALNRLFYYLGWTKGRTNYTFGNIAAEGTPDLATIKAKLMELAKKYDAAAPETPAPPRPLLETVPSLRPSANELLVAWENRLRNGMRVIVLLRDGTRHDATVLRRWAGSFDVIIPSNGATPIRVPRRTSRRHRSDFCLLPVC